jgi:hypothetical protein
VTAPNPDRSERFYGYAGYPEQNPAQPSPPPPPSNYQNATTGKRPRMRRPGRRGRRWLIALGVLIALIITADRVGVAVAESTLASQIQKDQKLSQKPGVSISGFPFLTQVISRDFGHVAVDIRGLNASDVPISDIHADLNGVHVSSGYNSATVDTITATAILTYTDLDKAIEKQVAGIGNATVSEGTSGQLKVTYDLAGFTVSAEVAVTLLPGNQLELKSGKIDTPLSDLGLATPDNFDFKLSLAAIPFGIQLKSLNVTSTAVDIAAVGHNVSLSQTSVSQQ